MNNEDYVSEALRTEGSYSAVNQRLSSNARLMHAALGLVTESAEFTDALKKHIYYGKPADAVNLKEELGDIFWYLAIATVELGVSFEDIMDANIMKLRARFPDKFSEDKAINRDVDRERQILELGLGGGV